MISDDALLLKPASPQVRDPDLVAELERHRGTFGFDAMARRLAETQANRDRERAYVETLSAGERRRYFAQREIEQAGPDPQHLRHIHSVLAICGLPYKRQPLEVREYERRQGRMSLVVEAGKLLSPTGERLLQPLPYGSRARLLLLHLCSEAIRQKSPTIHIEDSLTAFIRSIGFAVTGGANGTLASFKQQINALAACRMSIGVWNGQKARQINAQPFSQINVWLPTNPDQRMLWPSSITFSRDFFDSLSQHALPVNVLAVRNLANSPRKLDLLFWLGYRLSRLDKPLQISWAALYEQFGGGYTRERRFREVFANEIEQIREVLPRLPITLDEVGIVVTPGSVDVLAITEKPKPRTKSHA